jgi:hypothetical protein
MIAQGTSSRRRRGRPSLCPRVLLIRILDLREDGKSYREICAILNAEHVPTPEGKPTWYTSHVWRLLDTVTARALMEEIRGDRS